MYSLVFVVQSSVATPTHVTDAMHVFLNGTLAGALGLGLGLWVAGLVLWAIGYGLGVWAVRRDPRFVDVARRHLRYPTWMRS